MAIKLNKKIAGTPITDELHTSVGADYSSLDHDTFFGSTDMVIRTASGGGGTRLVENTDYTLHDEDTTLTADCSKTVYTTYKIINPTYQTVDLYFTYKSVGDYTEAEDINNLAADIAALDAAVVKKTGNQTIGDIKTFTSIPVLPASDPIADNQATRKKYIVDHFLGILAKAADSDKLDGIHGSGYLPIAGKAADSSKLNGAVESVAAGNNTIVKRHASGYIFANYFNTTPNNVGAVTPTAVCVETGDDGYIRHQTLANFKSQLGIGATLSWYRNSTAPQQLPGKTGDTTFYVYYPVTFTMRSSLADKKWYLRWNSLGGPILMTSTGNAWELPIVLLPGKYFLDENIGGATCYGGLYAVWGLNTYVGATSLA